MAIDMTGERYGKLVVLNLIERRASGHSLWACICDCGITTVSRRGALISGRHVSCGCHQKEQATTHGQSKTRLYNLHKSLKQRCILSTSDSYKNYGAKGITFCEEWADYEVFAKWAHANGYTDKLTIDRIDGHQGYGPTNCRWVSYSVQGRNKRKQSNTSSKYIGVSFRKNRKTKCWNASVRINNVTKCKSFIHEIDAAKWRDEMCRKHELIGTIYNF
jgi:hypothetical protein